MEAEKQPTADEVAEEARRILDVVADIAAQGGQPTLTAVRRAVQDFITFRLSEYVTFLDRSQLLEFRRADGTVAVTGGGVRALAADPSELVARVKEHFGDRLAPDVAPAPAVSSRDAAAHASTATQPPADVMASSPELDAPAGRGGTPAQMVASKERTVAHEDRFTRGEALGTGGLAVAYRARQKALDRTVVVKEFRDIFQYFTADQRTLIEGRLAEVVRAQARLCHPHIARVLDFDGDGPYPVVAVEHQVGGSLRDRIKSYDRMPVGLAIQYFLQIAEAVRYAHAQGVLHRNLKPENVLLDALGNAVVSDFGMTKIVERDDESIQQVYVGVGTVAYLAPEQYQDARNASVQSDIYSLGIMLYEMLTGKLPGRRSPMPSAYYDDVPAELDDIFDKMTMDFQDVRHKSMDDLLAEVYASDAVMQTVDCRAPVLFIGATGASAAGGAAPRRNLSPRPQAAPAPPAPRPAPARAAEEEDGPQTIDGPRGAASAAADSAPPSKARSAGADGGVSALLDDLGGDLFGDQ